MTVFTVWLIPPAAAAASLNPAEYPMTMPTVMRSTT
jgi:hypothetical protein